MDYTELKTRCAKTAAALALECREVVRDGLAARDRGDEAAFQRQLGKADGLVFAARTLLKVLKS